MVGLTLAVARRFLVLAFGALLVTGCAAPIGEKGRPAVDVDLLARLPRAGQDAFVTLTAAEALTSQAQGARVRWSGGIRTIDSREGGRDCFTVLQSSFDAQGYLRWPDGAPTFIACGPGHYDRTLLAPFVLASFEGRIAGQEAVLGRPVPVLEIGALYRHSDCVQGSEDNPECFAGLVIPRQP